MSRASHTNARALGVSDRQLGKLDHDGRMAATGRALRELHRRPMLDHERQRAVRLVLRQRQRWCPP